MKKYLLLAFVLFLFSCSEDDEESRPTEYNKNGIIPLNIGNQWQYEIEFFSSKDALPQYYENELTVFEDTIIDGVKYFLTLDKNNEYTISTNNDNGYYYYSFDTIINNDHLYFKFPCNLGDKWNVKIYPNEDIVEKYIHVKSLDVEVDVPVGRFKCINYELVEIDEYNSHDTIKTFYNFYICKGIGIVKETMEMYSSRTNDTTLYSNSYLKNVTVIE